MFHTNRTPPAAAAIALTFACCALAQDPAPPPTGIGPEAYVAVQPGTGPAKIVNPSDPAAQGAPEAKWDGDKPFIPAMHTPQFPAPQLPQEMLDGFKPVAMAAFNLANVSVQEAPIVRDRDDTLVRVAIDGVLRVVRLTPYSMRSDDARLVVDVGGGVLVEHAWPEIATYRGIVEGMSGLEAAASIKDGQVSMQLRAVDPQQPAWWVQPLSDGIAGMPPGLHAVYRGSDVRSTGRGQCGVGMVNGEGPVKDGPPIFRPPLAPVPPAPLPDKNSPNPDTRDEDGGLAGDDGSLAVANVRCQIALDADYEYYQANGSSVLNTIYEMERMMNFTGLIYQGQVGISYVETFIIIRSNINDPYTTGLTGFAMRDEFRDWWIGGHATVTRDVAHLFSNRSSTDGFIGFAYFAGICNANNGANSGYAWSSTFWAPDLANRVCTVAHELGHNWNATHCDGNAGCGIMNSSVSGSWTFGAPTAALITAHRDSRPCLDAWFDPCYVNNTWGGSENGSLSNPFNTIFEGLDACLVGGTLIVQAGNYLQNPNIFKAKNIQAVNGTVRIGN